MCFPALTKRCHFGPAGPAKRPRLEGSGSKAGSAESVATRCFHSPDKAGCKRSECPLNLPVQHGGGGPKAGHYVKVWKRILVNTPILTGAPLT